MSDKAQTTTVASGKRRQFLVDSARLACGVGLLGVGMGFYAEHAKALPPAALRPPGALPESELAAACIRCGRCIRHCPLRLMPSHIVAAYEAGNMERLAELKVNLCMECGCCSFGCPAHRPLVQTNKLAKAKLAAWRKAQSEKLDAKKEAVK